MEFAYFRRTGIRLGDGEVKIQLPTLRFTSWYDCYEELVRMCEITREKGGRRSRVAMDFLQSFCHCMLTTSKNDGLSVKHHVKDSTLLSRWYALPELCKFLVGLSNDHGANCCMPGMLIPLHIIHFLFEGFVSRICH